MNLKKILIYFSIYYILKFNFVFANKYDARVNLWLVFFISCIVIFNLICSFDDEKHHMLLSNILYFNLSDLEINFFFSNIVRLIFILAYYFFVFPIFIDFIIATIQILCKIIKKQKNELK